MVWGFSTTGGIPTLVFGLQVILWCPGLFELFVRPALGVLSGHSPKMQRGPQHTAKLVGSARGNRDRPVYHPCRLELAEGSLLAEALPWGGSADLLGLSRATGLLVLPKNCGDYHEGDVVEVIPLVSRFRYKSE